MLLSVFGEIMLPEGVCDLGMEGVDEVWGGVGVPLDCAPFSCLMAGFGAGPGTGSSSSLSLATWK